MLGGNRHGLQRRQKREVAEVVRPKFLEQRAHESRPPLPESGTFQIAKPPVRALANRARIASKR